MAKRRTPEEQIEAVKKELEQKQARLEKLLKDQKKQDDKARTHRLCKRGGKVEKLFPRLIEMSEEQFETFIQKTLLTGYAEKIINQILSPPSPAKPQGKKDTTQDGESAAPKPEEAAAKSAVHPAEATQNGGTGAQQNGTTPQATTNAHKPTGTPQNGGNSAKHGGANSQAPQPNSLVQ